jgi:hypothetical protein
MLSVLLRLGQHLMLLRLIIFRVLANRKRDSRLRALLVRSLLAVGNQKSAYIEFNRIFFSSYEMQMGEIKVAMKPDTYYCSIGMPACCEYHCPIPPGCVAGADIAWYSGAGVTSDIFCYFDFE